MNKQGVLWLALAVLMAAIAAVSSTADGGGNKRIRLSHHANRRGNGGLIRGNKQKTIVDYHTIIDVLKVDKNSSIKKGVSSALMDPRCSSCPDDCPPTCLPPATPSPTITPSCPTCPPPYPTPPYTRPTPPHTYPTPPHTHPTPPRTHPTHPMTHPTRPTHPTHPPVTKPPCVDCDHTCSPSTKPPATKFPNLPSITFSTNCNFCDHDLYALSCIETPFECASRCAVDVRCSHFTYIANHQGGTCVLKKAFGSGGSWASAIASPSPYVCGYIPSRALIGIFLDVCVGLDITGAIRTGTA